MQLCIFFCVLCVSLDASFLVHNNNKNRPTDRHPRGGAPHALPVHSNRKIRFVRSLANIATIHSVTKYNTVPMTGQCRTNIEYFMDKIGLVMKRLEIDEVDARHRSTLA